MTNYSLNILLKLKREISKYYNNFLLIKPQVSQKAPSLKQKNSRNHL